MITLKVNMVTTKNYYSQETFDFSNYSTESKYHEDSNKLVTGKKKDETRGVAVEIFVGLKPKMYSFLVGNNAQKKAKGVNKIVIATKFTGSY